MASQEQLESLEKVIPIPIGNQPHLQWWLQEDNVLTGQCSYTQIKHDLQNFTDASKAGWGAHLNKHTARGTWSLLVYQRSRNSQSLTHSRPAECGRRQAIHARPEHPKSVAMSSQIPLSLPNLPNLLTQPFNQIPHRNLTNFNLDARLLEPQHSRSRASLRRWQQELRLFKGDQPD